MADNMCGPSNGLQNFQKHTSVDRTLQQDRLTNRQSPSQGFRSTSGVSPGRLDPEFAAFQAGHVPLESQGLHPQAFPEPPQPFQQNGPSGWASDFQRLNISNPTPQFQSFTPQRQDVGGWHQEFTRQQNGRVADNNMHGAAGQMGPSYRASPMSGMGMGAQHIGGYANAQAQSGSMAYGDQNKEVFDEDAFTRAFEEAARQEEVLAQNRLGAEQHVPQMNNTREESGLQQESQRGEEVLLDESVERLLESEDTLATQGLIGADQIHHPPNTASQSQDQVEDHDALSRTAGQLLDSVQSDDSTKFKKSAFLELMRQLRDKEAMVEGDKIVRSGMRDEGTASDVVGGGTLAQASEHR